MNVILMILFLSFAAYSQAIKTDDGNRLIEVEKQIVSVENEIKTAENVRAELAVKYSPDYPKIKIIDAQISKLKERQLGLNLERKTLLSTN